MGRDLVAGGLIPTKRGAVVEEDGGADARGGGGGRLDEWNEKENKLVREARNEGVRLVLLPKGMSRRTKNVSKVDQKYVFTLFDYPWPLG